MDCNVQGDIGFEKVNNFWLLNCEALLTKTIKRNYPEYFCLVTIQYVNIQFKILLFEQTSEAHADDNNNANKNPPIDFELWIEIL